MTQKYFRKRGRKKMEQTQIIIPSYLISYQTIKFPLSDIHVFKGEDGIEETNFDAVVNSFIQGLPDEDEICRNVLIVFTDEYAIANTQYTPMMPQEKQQYDHLQIQLRAKKSNIQLVGAGEKLDLKMPK